MSHTSKNICVFKNFHQVTAKFINSDKNWVDCLALIHSLCKSTECFSDFSGDSESETAELQGALKTIQDVMKISEASGI